MTFDEWQLEIIEDALKDYDADDEYDKDQTRLLAAKIDKYLIKTGWKHEAR